MLPDQRPTTWTFHTVWTVYDTCGSATPASGRRTAPSRWTCNATRCRALLHESSLARTMPTARILTCRGDTTLVGRGRSSDSGSHSRERPHSPPVCMIGGFTSDSDVGSPEWLLRTCGRPTVSSARARGECSHRQPGRAVARQNREVARWIVRRSNGAPERRRRGNAHVASWEPTCTPGERGRIPTAPAQLHELPLGP